MLIERFAPDRADDALDLAICHDERGTVGGCLALAPGVTIENLPGGDVEKLTAPVQTPCPKRRGEGRPHPILRVTSLLRIRCGIG